MLKISDKKLPTKKLVNYGEDRFLWPPVDNYFHALGMEPTEPQMAFFNALNNPQFRFITACFSRRVGKTYAANIALQLVALTPNTRSLIIAPSYTLSNISWDLQKHFLNTFGIERVRENQKDKVIELINGSVIRVGSVARVDDLVGVSYDLIVFDEAAIDPKGGDAFDIALRPTLDKLNSKCVFISTPRGDNWFKEYYDRGFDDSDIYSDWISMHCTWEDNPRAEKRDVEQARHQMSSAKFAQEYLADFTTFEGQIYEAFDENNVEDLSELDTTHMEVIAGLDVGFRDPSAFIVILVDHAAGRFYIPEAWQFVPESTPALAKRVLETCEEWNVDVIYIDSAAKQTRLDLALYDLTVSLSKKSKEDGIGYVQGLVEKDRLVVDTYLDGLITAIKNYRWNDEAIIARPIKDKYSHYNDALRYAVYTYGRALEFMTADVKDGEEQEFDIDDIFEDYESLADYLGLDEDTI